MFWWHSINIQVWTEHNLQEAAFRKSLLDYELFFKEKSHLK